MNTRILCVTPENEEEVLSEAVSLILDGELVAFPTETVYGLGGNGLDPCAGKKIYQAKGRPSDNPLILHIGSMEQLPAITKDLPGNAFKLADAFWPGPLTMVLHKAACVPDTITGGLQTVAVRMPSHPVAKRFLSMCPVPIAAPSANLSGRPSTTRARHVIEDLDGRIACILDGGDVEIGVESTIVDLTGDTPVILRPGRITKQELEAVLGTVLVDSAVEQKNLTGHIVEIAVPKAPGMKYRHYAPKAPMTVLTGTEEEVLRALESLQDAHTGILTVDEHLPYFSEGIVLSVGTRRDPDSIAHNLFDVLRTFDERNVSRIFAEDFTETRLGDAVMNRLLKAAGGHVKAAAEIIAPETRSDQHESEEHTMIAVASDGAGYGLKCDVIRHLEELGLPYLDLGTDSQAAVDYPIYARKLTDAIISGQCDRGILMCGTGVGMSMTANRVKGIRAALCSDCFTAQETRLHNDANVLCMGERVIGRGLAMKIVDTFLETEFSGIDRHARRIRLMEEV